MPAVSSSALSHARYGHRAAEAQHRTAGAHQQLVAMLADVDGLLHAEPLDEEDTE
jgi:hypothetical protein